MFLGGGEDGVEIDFVRLALVDQPAGRMSDDVDVRVFERAENPLRDLFARLLLPVMHAGDDPIGLGEHFVGQIHASLFEDVALDPLEHREDLPSSSLILSISSHCFEQPLLIQAAGHADTRCE